MQEIDLGDIETPLKEWEKRAIKEEYGFYPCKESLISSYTYRGAHFGARWNLRLEYLRSLKSALS